MIFSLISLTTSLKALFIKKTTTYIYHLVGSKLAKGDLEKLFARVKQMNGVDDDKYWRKRSPWKQSNYIRSMKSKKSLAKAEKQFACCFA